MSTIKVYQPDPAVPFNSDELGPRYLQQVGSFDTALAQFWQGNESRDHERLWFTAEGKWVLTGAQDHYVADAEADAWLTENGYATEEQREIYVQRLP